MKALGGVPLARLSPVASFGSARLPR
jgi:hypothetical protein